MKKVLFTATVDSHILQFHLPFLKLFKENGYEVHVATNGDDEIPYCDVKHKISFERSPLKINNLKAIKQLKKICNEEKFDIIHTHTPMGSVVTRLAAKTARKKYHTRVIYTAHGFHFFKGAPLKNWLIFYPVEKWLSKYTDTLILINQEDYQLAKNKFSKRCHDIEYVPGVGIDEDKFNFKMTDKEKKGLRESIGLKENDFVLTFVARLDKNKNQGFLIDVMKRLIKESNNIHLLLVGPDEINGLYQEQANDIINNVHFLGYRSDIAKLLKISNVAVSSSLREGLPVNIMEAMACELPVVATDARGVRDLVEDNVNGYVIEKNNIDKFCNIVLKLIKNKNLYNEITKNNKELIKNYYLVDIISKMNNIYNKKKKVLHILSSNKYSGAENVACTIIENMSKDYDMTYCCPSGPIESVLKEKKIKYISINSVSVKEIRRVIATYHPDIVHSHDVRVSYLCTYINGNFKLISHIHGNHPFMRKLTIKSMLFNIRTHKFFHIFWVSDSAFDDYYYKKNIKNKSSILYNVIDEKKLINKALKDKKKYNIDIIFIGRLMEAKNPERFIKIIRKIKIQKNNINCYIVGDGELRDNILTKINEYNLKDNIKLVGFIDNPYKMLSNSKVMLMTSRHEGTPMVLLEAMCMGVPVVSTPIDGIMKFVNNQNGYLSNEDDILVEKCLEIVNDEKIRKEKSNLIKKSFDKLNDMKLYIVKIKKVYEEV